MNGDRDPRDVHDGRPQQYDTWKEWEEDMQAAYDIGGPDPMREPEEEPGHER